MSDVAAAAGSTRVDVVVDCDAGVDDLFGLAVAALHPRARLRAVSVVGGNVPTREGVHYARTILDLAGRSEVPVIRGVDGPGAGDGGGGERGARARAATALLDAVTSPGGGGQTVVVATGSLTNVALLLKAFPQAASSLAGVVFLGGAFHCPGNASPLAERNVFSDPEAASDVFASGVPVTLVPINVSGRFFLPPDLVDALSRGRRLLHDYLWAILQPLKSYYQVVFGADDCPIHDPLAVLVPLVPPELFTLRRAEVSIEVTGEMTRGVTFYDVRPEADLINQESRIQIIEDVDQPAAWREIASALGLEAVNPGG